MCICVIEVYQYARLFFVKKAIRRSVHVAFFFHRISFQKLEREREKILRKNKLKMQQFQSTRGSRVSEQHVSRLKDRLNEDFREAG